jgi:ectoine hydroxylase-related dioxygenase (phytanoyl-CoA dioxygenase family)
MREQGALSIWIALDDVDENNGCLSFIPRSRRLGRLDPVMLWDPQDIFKGLRRGELLDQVHVARMKAGGVTFHDGLTFHYANANRTGKTRHALAIIYMADGTTYTGKNHGTTNGLNLAVGFPLDHEIFPILA